VTDDPDYRDHVERPDSFVVRAIASLKRFRESEQARGGVPRTRFKKSTPDRPCQVIHDAPVGKPAEEPTR
jgi:hypothetical protein